jgi:citronellol/citronellal dehydrogenase
VHPMTIRDPEQVEQLIDVAWLHFGRIDVLVNNAGGQFPQRALDYSVKGWKAVIDTNLNGTWYMMHAMARRWQGTGTRGNIVNIVATFQRGMPGVAHTCAARAAVTHLSKTVAVEWAQHGIRVNCIAPGAIASTGFRQYSPEAVKAFAGANPMKHVGDVQDVAEAAVYLSAPSGKFVTGELLTVDGGGVLWGEVWTIAKPDYFKVNT